jgi:hypothetical protein
MAQELYMLRISYVKRIYSKKHTLPEFWLLKKQSWVLQRQYWQYADILCRYKHMLHCNYLGYRLWSSESSLQLYNWYITPYICTMWRTTHHKPASVLCSKPKSLTHSQWWPEFDSWKLPPPPTSDWLWVPLQWVPRALTLRKMAVFPSSAKLVGASPPRQLHAFVAKC